MTARFYRQFMKSAAPLTLSLAFMAGCEPAPDTSAPLLTDAVVQREIENADIVTKDSATYTAIKTLIENHRRWGQNGTAAQKASIDTLIPTLKSAALTTEARDGLLNTVKGQFATDHDILHILITGYDSPQGMDSPAYRAVTGRHAYWLQIIGIYKPESYREILSFFDTAVHDDMLESFATCNPTMAYESLYLPLMAQYDLPAEAGSVRHRMVTRILSARNNGYDHALENILLTDEAGQPRFTPDALNQMLATAITANNMIAVQKLAHNGASLSAQDSTVLLSQALAQNAHPVIVDTLLKNGADPDVTVEGRMALLFAVEQTMTKKDGWQTLDHLVRHGANIDAAMEQTAAEKAYTAHAILQQYRNARTAIDNAFAPKPAAPQP